MGLVEWAENEVRIACKRENPEHEFDSNDFDYGCSCYESALKAYKSLMEDGHSGYSFSMTKNILIRLMDTQPLTPITDADFFSIERGTELHSLESSSYLKERGLKSQIQCPRMCSLFRDETLDGKVSYHDNDRAYYVNIEEPSDTYGSWCGFIDEMFPITMPYMPKRGKYVIYAQSFLSDKRHGDYDTRGILYVITPEGEKVDINIFQTEGEDGKFHDITREEYDELLKHRVDKINEKIADRLLWTLISNSGNDKDIEVKEKVWKEVVDDFKDKKIAELQELCKFFDNPDNWKYNTFGVRQDLCKGELDMYTDVPELVKIGEWLGTLKNVISIVSVADRKEEEIGS